MRRYCVTLILLLGVLFFESRSFAQEANQPEEVDQQTSCGRGFGIAGTALWATGLVMGGVGFGMLAVEASTSLILGMVSFVFTIPGLALWAIGVTRRRRCQNRTAWLPDMVLSNRDSLGILDMRLGHRISADRFF